MKIDIKKDGSRMTAEISGRIDTNTAPEAENTILEELSGVSDLILDFTNVDYISSAGLRVLLLCYKAMLKQGTMIVLNVNDVVREILDVTGFSDILTIEERKMNA